MIKVIGVRFRTAGKIYFFDPLEFEIKRGDHVIVETARGVEYGTVVCDPKEVEDHLYFMSDGMDIALVCYEKPGDFCHRHLVAEWLRAADIPVEEWME